MPNLEQLQAEGRRMFKKKFPPVKNPRLGVVSSNVPTANQDEIISFQDSLIARAFEEGRKQQREELVERMKKKMPGLMPKGYDGNDLKSAEEYYGMAAENWTEIIRFEEGLNLGLSTAIALIEQQDEKDS